MSCTIPANQPIYEALQAKAKSYPSAEVFRRQAYQNAAMRLLTHGVDLFGIENSAYELADHLDRGWGPRTAAFIENFIKENPPVAKVACAVPANEAIYKALLEKAASYPADKPYQAKAYKKAAETVMSYEKNIYDEYSRYNVFYDYPGNIGPRIEEFIRKFIKENPSTATPDGREDEEMKHPDCFTPSNNGLYVALLKRAREREEAGNKYAAKHYRNAAAKVLSHPQSFPWLYRNRELHSEIEALGGPGVAAFIKLYLEESLYPPVLKPTEDDIIKRTIKVYCYKNNLTYQDILVAEYKAWRPTARSWALESYDYTTDRTTPKTTEEVVKGWAEMGYSETLRAEKKENSYKTSLVNYCKKNNIIYQPLMLERFTVWRNDPANKKQLVNTFPSCGCGGDACESTIEYPMGTTAAINRWFQTLPKTVSL
jgi:hypothetical protein